MSAMVKSALETGVQNEWRTIGRFPWIVFSHKSIQYKAVITYSSHCTVLRVKYGKCSLVGVYWMVLNMQKPLLNVHNWFCPGFYMFAYLSS